MYCVVFLVCLRQCAGSILYIYMYMCTHTYIYTYIKGKVKVHPSTGHKGPEGEERYSSTLSLTLTLDVVDGQRQAPASLPQGKRRGSHCIGGWVVPRVGLDGCGKSRSHRDSIPGPSSLYRVAIQT